MCSHLLPFLPHAVSPVQLVGVNISFDATTIEEHERDLQRLMAPHCARMTANNSATQVPKGWGADVHVGALHVTR